MVAALGYAIFGVGVEAAGITVSKIIVRWFKGKEMALAMGLEMATARLGNGLGFIYHEFFRRITSVASPLLSCFVFCMLCIGLIAFLVFLRMDRAGRFDGRYRANRGGRAFPFERYLIDRYQ